MATLAELVPPAAKPPKKQSWDDRLAAGEAGMTTQANAMAAQEAQRYALGLRTATQQYDQPQSALGSLIDPSLTFSKAADAIGARSSANMDALRRSLGAS